MNIIGTANALRTQHALSTQAAKRTATATHWTKTPTPSSTPTPTPTFTLTATNTPLPPLLAFPLGTERTDAQVIKQVYVPAGCFMMGSDPTTDQQAQSDEQPQHKVCITHGYWLDEYEVTNAAFNAFAEAGGYKTDSYWSVDGLAWKRQNAISGPYTNCAEYLSQAQQPRICLNFYEAEAYAKWRGGRLPTEAEWEYAARGEKSLIYPWGNYYQNGRANIDESRDGGRYLVKTTAVGSYPNGRSWVGAYDMAGNTSEWVADWYDGGYYARKIQDDPTGPASGIICILRGGSWFDYPDHARAAYRYTASPNKRLPFSGVRVVSGVGVP